MELSKTTFEELKDGKLDCIHVRNPTSQASSAEFQLVFPGSFNPFHTGHQKMAERSVAKTKRSLWFELSISNVDKASLEYEEVAVRLKRIVTHPDFGVVLTNAPTFEQKLSLFPKACFVVGADTIQRINHNRFYKSESHRRRAFEAFQPNNSRPRFRVFGRQVDGAFHQGDDGIAIALKQLCVFVPQQEFDLPISSTEIRKQADG